MQTIITRNEPDMWGEQEWVAQHVSTLFGFAAEQFAAIGRGVVVLDMRTPEGRIAAYVPAGEIPQAEGRDVRQRVEHYNPANQTVVVVVGPGLLFRVVTISALFLQGPMN
jgi:hypothetical protein